MRARGALAALALLAGCGVIGPSQADLADAARAFIAHPSAESASVATLEGASISDFEGCQPLNGVFRCAVGFATPAGRVATTMWVVRENAGWRVQNIALNERPS